MGNITLGYVMDRVEAEYQRMTPKVKARLTADINSWVARACRKWNFWFLECEPGLSTFKLFPFSTTDGSGNPITLASQLTFITIGGATSAWIDRGWMATTQGSVAYPVAYPFMGIWDATDDPPMTSANMQGWAFTEIKRLLFVKVINGGTGRPRKDLEVLPYQAFLTKQRFDAQAEPDYCTFVTENGLSSIIFNTIPDQTYICQVSFALASLPDLDTPQATHLMLQYYPQLLVTVGLLFMSKYFGEKAEQQVFLMDLFGQTYAQERNPELTPGGMIGDIISEGRQRHTGRAKTLKVYTSARRALGRQGSMRKWIPGGYYWDGFGGP